MRNLYCLFLLLAGLGSLGLTAQTVVPVAPGNGTINQAIDDYIAANGLPTADVTFELESGGIYILTSTLENRTEVDGEDEAYPLNIAAAADYTAKPIIRPGVSADGEAFRVANIRGDFSLRGVYVTNEDALGGLDDRILRIRSSDVTIRLFDVHLDKASQAAIRIDDPGVSLFMDRCIVSNIVNLSNPSNGRAIDDRGNDIDTLHIRNTTFYNLSARVLRDDGGVIDYVLIDQVTTYNTGDRIFQLGRVNEATVTNCLFYNTAFLGDDEAGSSVIQLDENDDVEEVVTISHINFADDPAVQTLFDSLNTVGLAQVFIDEDQDSVFFRTGLSSEAAVFADSATIYTEAVTSFVNPPATPLAYVRTFYTTPDDTDDIDDANGGPDPGETLLPIDLAYGTNEFIYTAGDEGQPLGDLQWFPEILASDFEPTLINRLALKAFPNPAAGQTNLAFTLPAAQRVNVRLFTAEGRLARDFAPQDLPAGVHNMPLDLSGLARGQYFYQFVTEAGFGTGRIVIQ